MTRRHVVLLALLLTACAPAGGVASTLPSERPDGTTLPAPFTATPPPSTASPPPTAAPPSAPGRCADGHGRVVEAESTAEPGQPGLRYRVYLPPCLEAGLGAPYPVLFLLHGLGADEGQWENLGAVETADRLIREGRLPPFLMVFPYEPPRADMEAVLVEGLIPAIEGMYPTRRAPSGWAVGGLSRGGGWALRIGFKHPDRFGSVGLHSPAVFGPDYVYLDFWTRGLRRDRLPRLWVDIGDRDPLRPATLELRRVLEDLDIPHTYREYPGRHEAAYWSAHVETYLLWYGQAWKEAPERAR